MKWTCIFVIFLCCITQALAQPNSLPIQSAGSSSVTEVALSNSAPVGPMQVAIWIDTTGEDTWYGNNNGIPVELQAGHSGRIGGLFFAGADNQPTEDSLNLFFDDINDFLALGHSSPTVRLHIVGNNAAQSTISLVRHTNLAGGAEYSFYKGRGTVAAPLNVLPGDTVSMHRAFAYHSGGYHNIGAYGMQVETAITGLPEGQFYIDIWNDGEITIERIFEVDRSSFRHVGYDQVRDDTGTEAPTTVLYPMSDGTFGVAPLSAITTGGLWIDDLDGTISRNSAIDITGGDLTVGQNINLSSNQSLYWGGQQMMFYDGNNFIVGRNVGTARPIMEWGNGQINIRTQQLGAIVASFTEDAAINLFPVNGQFNVTGDLNLSDSLTVGNRLRLGQVYSLGQGYRTTAINPTDLMVIARPINGNQQDLYVVPMDSLTFPLLRISDSLLINGPAFVQDSLVFAGQGQINFQGDEPFIINSGNIWIGRNLSSLRPAMMFGNSEVQIRDSLNGNVIATFSESLGIDFFPVNGRTNNQGSFRLSDTLIIEG